MDVYNMICDLNNIICDNTILDKQFIVDNKIDDIKNYVIEKYPNHSEYIATYILRYKAIEWNNMSLLDGSYIYKLLSCH